jgi:hypothetical protein
MLVFKLGGIHILKGLQYDALDALDDLINIDNVGVDAPEFVMKARQLGSIHGVDTVCTH